jgi:hypothetical protein
MQPRESFLQKLYNKLIVYSGARFSRPALHSHIAEQLHIENNELEKRLAVVEMWIRHLDSINADTMTFEYNVRGLQVLEPRALLDSDSWKRIGKLLCSLGSLVGADVPRRLDERKSVSVLIALQNVANNEGRAINIMLARIEAQSLTIRKQEQAITALQFRHLLEMVPGGGQSPPPRQATPQWKQFWAEAVTTAYNEYLSTPSPPPPNHTPRSPLAGLLNEQFNRAKKLKVDHTKQTKWLIEETDVSMQAKALYSTLSTVIHHYSSAEFSVHPQAYSPGDVRLLQALSPQIVNGVVDWAAEKNRYIW